MFADVTIHQVGDFLLRAGLVVAVFSAVASVVGFLRKDGRLLVAGERAGYAVTGIMVTAAALLVHALLTHDYANKYVQRYSDNNMPWYYLAASLWGGQAGSFMFWVLILSIVGAIVIWQNRYKNRDLMPTVITVMMGVMIFFLAMMVFQANPFETFRINEPPVNGRGLNPLLQNPAMTFHPPAMLSGYIWFTAPFAFGVAALIHKRLDDAWIVTTRRYSVVAWGFLSMGNLLGGMWAYQELGWGGFWGWDPVENAALMPWITCTAYLHSVMIQERRDTLRAWNVILVQLTFFLTIFGTGITRGGLIDSVHTFAQSEIGTYFIISWIVLGLGCIGLTLWRVFDGSLRGKGKVDHLASREGVFLLNNYLLVVMMFVVMYGTMGEKISEFLWEKTKYTASWFNTWMAPSGIALLLLMGIGPLIPWRRVSLKALQKNFLVPTALSAVATFFVWYLDWYDLRAHLAATSFHIPEGASLSEAFQAAELVGVYSLVGFFGCIFTVYTMLREFWVAARVRSRSVQESFGTALVRLVTKNKRRWGGYISHIGFACLFLGFIGTGLKTELDFTFNGKGEVRQIKDRQLTFQGFERTANREFEEWFAVFKVDRINSDASLTPLGTLRPSKRFYLGNAEQPSSYEKDEMHGFAANIYLNLVAFQPQIERADVMAHYNPMIFWMWVGGALLSFGVVFSIWPDSPKYPVFAAARRKAAQAAAAASSQTTGAAPAGAARQATD